MQLLLVLVSFTDQLPTGPEPEDVKAGWTAFAIFLLLGLALALLMVSMAKQLRKAQAAKDAGVYDEPEGSAGQQHESRSD